ncbi:MAG: helicase [Verrucomicrobia bacterium]|nr:MAG: helicase [Verrucomicrobiota bacterium]
MIDKPASYETFLRSKRIVVGSAGKDISIDDVHPGLFAFQRQIVVWACRKGRCAVLADTGLGKTRIQLEWARLMGQKTLIIAPLSVARQTVREGQKIDVDVRYVRSQAQVMGDHKLWITNYEMLDHFDASQFGAVVIDESSILKALDSSTRRKLTEMFISTPYKLACTATPAPNDRAEIGNHSEFLGITKMSDMLAMFFVHANKETISEVGGYKLRRKLGNDNGQEWRLKHHAEERFYRWMASWAMSIRKPSDIGFDDAGYELPPLHVKPVWIDYQYTPADQLVFTGLNGLSGARAVRRETLDLRCRAAADLVNANDEQWIVWTGLNDESALMAGLIPGSIEVVGSDSPEDKAAAIEAFQDGKYRVLVTKVSIAGFGMNFQNCHNQVFVGLSYSWEEWYQAIRRCYRFGQHHAVNIRVVLSQSEQEVFDTIMSKEAVAKDMSEQLIRHVSKYEMEELNSNEEGAFDYQETTVKGNNWTALLGDSCQRLAELADNSIDLSVYSPPFANLYVYSASEHDLGNSRTSEEFFSHYGFVIREILRVTKPGRLTCVHTADIPAMASRDGYIGMKDFPGEVIRAYEENGWIYHGYAVVAKNPQAQAIRTHSKALLFVQVRKDSASSRPAILDRVLFFYKPGDNLVPVTPVANGEMDNETWIDWAGGIWTGISESDTLQYQAARDPDDELHLCPLQLGTIERCIKLYSNPGETVLTPFMGVSSEVYSAVKLGRKGIGIELKPSYFAIALKNLRELEVKQSTPTLFDMTELSAQWPAMPDLQDGIDRFSEYEIAGTPAE